MKAVVLIDIPDSKFDGIEEPLAPPMYANVTLDYGDKVIYWDGEVKKIELFSDKEQLKKAVTEHFSNPYCASTDLGKVMYEKEIMKLIDRN